MKARFRLLTMDEKAELAKLIERENLAEANEHCETVVFKETIYNKYVKRVLDIIIATVVLIICLPVNLIIAVITLFDVGLPLLYFQERICKGGQMFRFGKFRNMRELYDEHGALLLAEERITKWGHFVRKTSLDELLNFWYILIGKMSVIGPRPMPYEYLHRFNNRHQQRHLVRPGLECPLRQEVRGGMTWENRFENDVWYVANISFKTDIKMIMLLIADMLSAKRRAERSNAVVGTFLGYEKDGTIIESDTCPERYYDMLGEYDK